MQLLELFGFKVKTEKENENLKAVTPKTDEDGSLVVAPGGAYGTFIDLEGSAKTEAELVGKYREISLQPELDYAIDEIVNEAITTSEDDVVSLNLDNLEGYSESFKKKVRDEFQTVTDLLNFNNMGYDIFRRWYIDGRLNYELVIDQSKPGEGVKDVRYIDPRKLRKVREIGYDKIQDGQEQLAVQVVKAEYYVYNDKGFSGNTSPSSMGGMNNNLKGIKISKDSIVQVGSGLMNENNSLTLSYLHKAIKPLNQLRALEDSAVIYRIARAPERRIFYIDVGNLPKLKAEQYLRDMMVKHKNKLVYDAMTGDIRDDRKHMTMLEDFWLPRREGGRGTEITTLPGGQNLGEMADVEYFQQKLYKSLNIPVSRLNPDTGFSLGRAAEISRDEVKFAKFIARLRKRFSFLFLKILEKQLILKNIITPEEWAYIETNLKVEFASDSHFMELKEMELLMNRLDALDKIQNYVGVYYSTAWVKRHVLKQSDEMIEEMEDEMSEEPPPPPPEGMDGEQPN